jgi:hypothetical protein
LDAELLKEKIMNDAIYQSPTLPIVRQEVKDILVKSKAFGELPPETKRELAGDMVKIAHYIVGGDNGLNVPTAASLAGGSKKSEGKKSGGGNQNPPPPPGGFVTEAGTQGTQNYTDLVAGVDFPNFVAGLIDGVFNAIVDTSIKQMEAYAELVKNISKSVDQYMKDNISENQSREYLVNRYPDYLEADLNGEKATVKVKEGHDENNMPDFFNDLGLKMPLESFDNEKVEEQLVPAARRRMAMDRQQLLATMVMMGINRLVVTNGSIKSKVNFKLDTVDKMHKDAKRSFSFTQHNEGENNSTAHRESGFLGKIFSNSRWRDDNSTAKFSVDTENKAERNESMDKSSKLHADLMGEVNINFKSDYFPMEKMTEILGIGDLQERYTKKPKEPVTTAPAIGGK